jgi:PAS domain S-box-containing protein
MAVRANLAVAIEAIRELLEEALRSRRADAATARALGFALQGLSALWDALVDEEANRDQNERDCAEVFESASEAYVITDLNGIVRRANSAAAQLFGVPVSALLRRPLDERIVSLPGDRLAREARLAYLRSGAEVVRLKLTVRELGRKRGRITGLCWSLRRVRPSAQPGEEQKQAAEHGEVAEEVDAREVALRRVALLPEAMEDRRRRDGEHDQAGDPERRVPVEVDERAARELQRDAEPEGGARERNAERGHALDVVGDARPGEVARAGDDEVGEEEVHAREVEPALHQTPR